MAHRLPMLSEETALSTRKPVLLAAGSGVSSGTGAGVYKQVMRQVRQECGSDNRRRLLGWVNQRYLENESSCLHADTCPAILIDLKA